MQAAASAAAASAVAAAAAVLAVAAAWSGDSAASAALGLHPCVLGCTLADLGCAVFAIIVNGQRQRWQRRDTNRMAMAQQKQAVASGSIGRGQPLPVA